MSEHWMLIGWSVAYASLVITEVLFTLLDSKTPPYSEEIRMPFWAESTLEEGWSKKAKKCETVFRDSLETLFLSHCEVLCTEWREKKLRGFSSGVGFVLAKTSQKVCHAVFTEWSICVFTLCISVIIQLMCVSLCV